MSFNIDSAIFIGFLVATIFLGLFSSYGVKNIKEYAIGNRNFSTATIVATIVATWASGQAFFTILLETYSSGLYFLWSVMGYILCLLSIGIVFAPRMGEFLGKLSIAEAMGDMYGKHVRIITAITGFVASAGMIALQLKVSGMLFSYCFGSPEIYGIFVGGAIITFYSSLGGIKSVTFTDIIQFLTFGTMIPALALFIMGTLDSVDVLTHTITTHELFDYNQVFDFSRSKSVYFIFLFLFNFIPAFNPAFFQRIVIARNTAQVKKSFVISAFTCLFIVLTIAFISLLILSTHPELDNNDIVKHILLNYTAPGLKGFILAGIMAMVMSTADSYINSTSVLFVHDFWKPLDISIIKNELFSARLASALLGLISILLATRSGSLLQLIIASNMFYMPIVTVPFIMSVFGFRSSGKSVLIGMIGGFITVIIWESFLNTGGIDGLIPGMVANLICLIGSHYILSQPGGWVGIKDGSSLLTIRKTRDLKRKNFINLVLSFNLIKFLYRNSPKEEAVIVYTGLFCIISLYVNMYTIPKELKLQYSDLVNFISPSILFAATALLSYPLWLTSWKENRVISIVWNLVVFYVLVCGGFLFAIISNFAPSQVMILIINLILIVALVRWQWAIVMIFVGLFITMQFINFYLEPNSLPTNSLTLQLKILYPLLLVSSILMVFFKHKQEHQELTEEQNEHLNVQITAKTKEVQEALALKAEFIRNMNHEHHAPMTGVMSMSEILQVSYDKLNDEQRKKAIDVIVTSTRSLKSLEDNLTTLTHLSKPHYKLNKENIDLSSLVYDRVQTCRRLYEENKEDREFILNIDENVMANVDRSYMLQLFDNLIINSINYCKKGTIKIVLSRDKDNIHFVISDTGIGIPQAELYDIFEPFTVSSKTRTPAGGRGVGLAVCTRILEVHGGTIKAESEGKKGAAFTVALPL